MSPMQADKTSRATTISEIIATLGFSGFLLYKATLNFIVGRTGWMAFNLVGAIIMIGFVVRDYQQGLRRSEEWEQRRWRQRLRVAVLLFGGLFIVAELFNYVLPATRHWPLAGKLGIFALLCLWLGVCINETRKL